MTDPDTALRDYDRVCEENEKLEKLVYELCVSLSAFFAADQHIDPEAYAKKTHGARVHYASAAAIAQDLGIDITAGIIEQ